MSPVELDNDSNNAVDIADGGTNSTTAAGARTNLDVYSKAETDLRGNLIFVRNAFGGL